MGRALAKGDEVMSRLKETHPMPLGVPSLDHMVPSFVRMRFGVV